MAKVRVRLGSAEAEVEADPEHLADAIEMVPKLLAKLPVGGARADRVEEAQAPAPALEAVRAPVEMPMVTLEKGDSLADVIGKFFDDRWGRERRKLSDVREALSTYGLNYPKQSVAVALLRLAKSTKIRRFKADDGEFVYTSSGVRSPGPEPVVQEIGQQA